MDDADNFGKSALSIIHRAANTNRPPKNNIFKRLVVISIFVAPVVIWLLWAN